MALFRGVFPVKQETVSGEAEAVVAEALRTLLAHGAVKENDRVLLTFGDRMGQSGGTNSIRFVRLDQETRARYGI